MCECVTHTAHTLYIEFGATCTEFSAGRVRGVSRLSVLTEAAWIGVGLATLDEVGLCAAGSGSCGLRALATLLFQEQQHLPFGRVRASNVWDNRTF